MLIGGLQKSTLIDYPGKVGATVFTIGCNFKCGFCHNPELVDQKKIKGQPQISEAAFFDFLKERQGLLDGICITGGEPLIQKDIIDFIKKIKKLNFLVKLDTNGSKPKILEKLFQQNLLDFAAMDIKSSKQTYSKTSGIKVNLKDIQKSIDLITQSKVDYEFRTTIAPGLLNQQEIERIGQWLKGSKKLAIQQCRMEKTLDPSWKNKKSLPDEELKQMTQIAKKYFREVELRGA